MWCFNSRTPGGVRLYLVCVLLFSLRSFNSRTPGGVRHKQRRGLDTRRGVSIHAPREGCDSVVAMRLILPLQFQFTHPGRGATILSSFLLDAVEVSIHAPREGCDARTAPLAPLAPGFNSRTPGGVRLSVSAPLAEVSKFQFTHPGRGATINP